MGGEGSIPGRIPEGQHFIALWSLQSKIPLGWVLVDLRGDDDGDILEGSL